MYHQRGNNQKKHCTLLGLGGERRYFTFGLVRTEDWKPLADDVVEVVKKIHYITANLESLAPPRLETFSRQWSGK